MTHRNARLTPVTRAELVEHVMAGWPQAEVARLFRVSRATVAKWMRRFREGGRDALRDRSSRPHRSPRRTSELQEAVICAARRILAQGPHRIGQQLGIARSTVYAVLRRAGLHRLAWLHRATREIVRYEHERAGELRTSGSGRRRCGATRTRRRCRPVGGPSTSRCARTRPFRPQTNGKAEAFIKLAGDHRLTPAGTGSRWAADGRARSCGG